MVFTPPTIGRIAFLQAAIKQKLEEMILKFDYFELSNGQACLGYPEPLNLAELVHSFIGDKEFAFSYSDTEYLKRLESYVKTNIQAAYVAGKEQATQIWLEADDSKLEQFMHYEVSDFQAIAKNLVPDYLSTAEKNWYFEGFGWQWMEEWAKNVLNKKD